jgi:hypothetical protein
MPEATTGSTVPRRQLGRHLRELRNRSRTTIKQAAEQLEWSEPKLWRIETGDHSTGRQRRWGFMSAGGPTPYPHIAL